MLGARHAMDPDHVAAITTIVARERTLARARLTGALWGIGHSVTVFIFGGALAVFRVSIPNRMEQALELGVAVMLVWLGIASLLKHADTAPAGPARPLAVGFVHGLAGSGAIAVLLTAAATTPLAAIGYLTLFAVGTIAGMMVLTTAIAAPTILLAGRISSAGPTLRIASGVASIVVGLFVAHDVIVVRGLFLPGITLPR